MIFNIRPKVQKKQLTYSLVWFDIKMDGVNSSKVQKFKDKSEERIERRDVGVEM